MQRVWITGVCGSGKSTLARQLAQQMGARCVDLDELHWRPNWQNVPDSEFIAALEHATQSPSWVIAGNYSRIQPHFLPLTDTIIWLDYPFIFVLWRLLKRTMRRVFFRELCCNGNTETLRLVFSSDSILLWFFRTYSKRRRTGWNIKRHARKSGVRFVHFRSPSQCARWLQNNSCQTCQ